MRPAPLGRTFPSLQYELSLRTKPDALLYRLQRAIPLAGRQDNPLAPADTIAPLVSERDFVLLDGTAGGRISMRAGGEKRRDDGTL